MIYFADGKRVESFSWGLGHKTNNHAEILGLLKACQVPWGKGIKDVPIFGYSETLIKILNSDSLFNDPLLNKTLKRLRLVLHDFSSFIFFHILRGLNKEADTKENLGCLLSQGILKVDEEEAQWVTVL